MKLMKNAALNNIPYQVRHFVKSFSFFCRSGTLSEHVAQLRLGNKPGKVYTVFIRL